MISKNSISRLSEYRSTLKRLKSQGTEKITSRLISEELGLTAEQVRKDFSLFGISGNRRGGYHLDTVLAQLDKILHKNKTLHAIIVGAGNIGTALMNYKGFEGEAIKITDAFDVDLSKISREGKTAIRHFNDLERVLRQKQIDIGIICVPNIAAQKVCNRLISAGIRGILNFAPIPLKVPAHCVVKNVNLVNEFEFLAFYLNERKNFHRRGRNP